MRWHCWYCPKFKSRVFQQFLVQSYVCSSLPHPVQVFGMSPPKRLCEMKRGCLAMLLPEMLSFYGKWSSLWWPHTHWLWFCNDWCWLRTLLLWFLGKLADVSSLVSNSRQWYLLSNSGPCVRFCEWSLLICKFLTVTDRVLMFKFDDTCAMFRHKFTAAKFYIVASVNQNFF